ncbi:MAG: hypothetical protein ACMUHB_04065, partial [Thermoplasmatota archaeon]
MKRSIGSGSRKDRKQGPTILGVSEAVGTVLLLGISVVMVGGLALWTSQIEDTEEGLFVDLWARVDNDDLSIIHRGGDILDGSNTVITVRNSDGSIFSQDTYYDPADGRTDENWGSGEEVDIDISGATKDIRLVITTIKNNGASTVIMNNELSKEASTSGKTDLAITRLVIQDTDGTYQTTIFESGVYQVLVDVTNFGTDLTDPYFIERGDNMIQNLVIFDEKEELRITSVSLAHYDGSTGDLIPETDGSWGILKSGDRMSMIYNWEPASGDPRSLGVHEMNAKVIPFPDGEVDYRNNVAKRKFIVDKELNPVIIPGPDPGIYDIYFSNDVPHSGEQVTVTVVVQNAGSEPMVASHHVNMVVTLWLPKQIKPAADVVTYDWQMDYPGHYGNWRSGDYGFELTEDNEFPTCVVKDLVLLPGAYLFFYFTLEARVDIPGGQQNVYAVVDAYDDPDPPEALGIGDGDDPGDNIRLATLQVLPRILLVDDDGAVTGTEGDMTSTILESLTGAGVGVDTIFVAQSVDDTYGPRDAPAFTYTKAEIAYPAMEDYDIVVWVTGEQTDALTNTPRGVPTDYGGNIQEMMDFMASNGYLLIVGTRPYMGLGMYLSGGNTQSPDGAYAGTQDFYDVRDFLYKYMGVSVIEENLELPYLEGDYLTGIDKGDDGITQVDEPADLYTIALKQLEAGNQKTSRYVPRDVVELLGPDPYFDIPVSVMTTKLWEDTGNPWANTVRASSIREVLPEGDLGPQYRAVTVGWDVREIRYLNGKIGFFADIMRWFDWEIRVGRDLSITRMEMFLLSKQPDNSWDKVLITEDTVPKYLDTVEIDVTVRNNGPHEESSTLIFYVTGPNGIELPITPNIPDPRPIGQRTDPLKQGDPNPLDVINLDGKGNEVSHYKLWLALGAGLYTFRVEVDPYHLISEVNEDNNDITYSTSTLASFVAENNILIVDDDGSLDNFVEEDRPSAQSNGLVFSYPDGEPSGIIEEMVVGLEYDYEVITVQNYHDLGWVMGNGPDIVDLKRFNSVIWVTGQSGNKSMDRETLTDVDIVNIMRYLNGLYDEAKFLDPTHNENLMIVGEWLQWDMGENDVPISIDGMTTSTHQFLREYLGIEPLSAEIKPYSGLSAYGPRSGEFSDDAYLGVEYRRTSLEGGLSFRYVPIDIHTGGGANVDTRTALYTFDIHAQPVPVTVQHKMMDEVEENYFRTIYHSWDITKLVHNVVVEGNIDLPLFEAMFLPLNWFDTPEDDPELVSRSSLLEISSDHPSIGNSYVLSVKITNLGGDSGGGTVRFQDGDSLFKSEFIFLDPGDEITLEALWEPQYAGSREISIWIDRFNDWEEVFDTINNIPTRTIRVYYFWDDLEENLEEWKHDSTVALINGESPLDYYDPVGKDPDTNIIKDWDDTMSSEVVRTTEEYHSSPSSFQLREASGKINETADVIISFVIDDSASMTQRKSLAGNTWLDEAKDAALILLNELSDDSVVVSIWDFQGNLERRFAGPTDRGTSEGGIPTKVRRNPIRIGDDFGGVSGRERVRAEIDKMSNPGGTTILWDSIGEAYLDTLYWSTYYPELDPVVVVLSDGMDLQASDKAGLSTLTADAKVEV